MMHLEVFTSAFFNRPTMILTDSTAYCPFMHCNTDTLDMLNKHKYIFNLQFALVIY